MAFRFFGIQKGEVRRCSKSLRQVSKCFSSPRSRWIWLHPEYACQGLIALFVGNEAGLAFENAAAIQKNNLEEQYEAANNLVEASKSYRKHDPVNALRVLQQAIDYYTENGNFRRAATYVQEMAEIYDFDIGDKRKAADLYEKAAGWFDAENAKQ